jgi:hypothetical protein
MLMIDLGDEKKSFGVISVTQPGCGVSLGVVFLLALTVFAHFRAAQSALGVSSLGAAGVVAVLLYAE